MILARLETSLYSSSRLGEFPQANALLRPEIKEPGLAYELLCLEVKEDVSMNHKTHLGHESAALLGLPKEVGSM